MKKSSFSLIEVLIAIALLSFVMITVFQIKDNNLNDLIKFKALNENNEKISIATLYENNNSSNLNTHIYLNNVLTFKNDDLSKELKNTKVFIKSKLFDSLDLSEDKLQLNVDIYERNYKIENKINKNFYNFKLLY